MSKPSEYSRCRVVGHGYRFIPGYVQTMSRIDKKHRAGQILGTVVLWSESTGTRTVDSDPEPHTEDPLYDVGEKPVSSDVYTVMKRMMDTHPLGDYRVLVKTWETKPGYGNKPFTSPKMRLAPPDFQIPSDPEENTQPENSVMSSSDLPENSHTIATLGDIARVGKLKDKKNQEQPT